MLKQSDDSENVFFHVLRFVAFTNVGLIPPQNEVFLTLCASDLEDMAN